MRIGIDIDEVIADSLSAIIAFHNETYKTAFKRDDFLSYKFWETWGGSKEEAIQKMQIFNDKGHVLTTRPIEGAFTALTSLKEQGHELFAITARSHRLVKQTEEWVSLHFPNIFREIRFGNTWGMEGTTEKKSDICKHLSVSIMIEDDIDHAIDCARCGITVILLDCPWNQGLLPEHVHRVFSWNEAIQLISEHN